MCNHSSGFIYFCTLRTLRTLTLYLRIEVTVVFFPETDNELNLESRFLTSMTGKTFVKLAECVGLQRPNKRQLHTVLAYPAEINTPIRCTGLRRRATEGWRSRGRAVAPQFKQEAACLIFKWPVFVFRLVPCVHVSPV